MPKVFKEPKPLSQQYVADERWINEQITQLTRQYPDQWIAVLNQEVVAFGKHLGAVYRVAEQKADEAGIDQCVYSFIEGRPRYYSDQAVLPHQDRPGGL
jgi:hypothetical protein